MCHAWEAPAKGRDGLLRGNVVRPEFSAPSCPANVQRNEASHVDAEELDFFLESAISNLIVQVTPSSDAYSYVIIIITAVTGSNQMAPRSPPGSPSHSPSTFRRRTKTFARRCERTCCTIATYFPLVFVYTLTTWAAYTEIGVGFRPNLTGSPKSPYARSTSLLAFTFYLLLNTCYTIAVFTDPGSPLHPSTSGSRGGKGTYTSLPTTEPSHDPQHAQRNLSAVTVSSTGQPRYCKKCQCNKPDRTHHCSTCKRCVLKMDHHCPWLATCLGQHNYKAFVLFLIYTCFFCYVCFASTAWYVYTEILSSSMVEDFTPVNVVMLAVISGIIGIVLTGFTGWHLYLCVRGQTTIECLEKTRYLTAVRKQVEHNRQNSHSAGNGPLGYDSSQGVKENLQRAGEQILEFHANAVPGATRMEEGEEHASPPPSTIRRPEPVSASFSGSNGSPAQNALRKHMDFADLERQRESRQYEDYVDEEESSKLPNAFDLGWRRNLFHVLGPNILLWPLPILNTTGNGWQWELNETWVHASQEIKLRKEDRIAQSGSAYDQTYEPDRNRHGYDGTYDGISEPGGFVGQNHRYSGAKGQSEDAMSLQTFIKTDTGKSKGIRRDFDRSSDGELDQYEVSSDEDFDQNWQHKDRRKGRGKDWTVWT